MIDDGTESLKTNTKLLQNAIKLQERNAGGISAADVTGISDDHRVRSEQFLSGISHTFMGMKMIDRSTLYNSFIAVARVK